MPKFEAKNVSINGTVEVSATYEGDPSVGIPMGWEMEFLFTFGNVRVTGVIDNREWDKNCGEWPLTDLDLYLDEDKPGRLGLQALYICGVVEAKYPPDRPLTVKDIPLVYDQVQNVMKMIHDAEEEERKAEEAFFEQSGGYSEGDK